MTSPLRLGQILVELADTLVSDFDLVEFLTTVADRCVEVLGTSAAGVAIADPSNVLCPLASSNEATGLLGLRELSLRQGPSIDCYRAGQQLLNQPLAPADQWPAFAAEALAAGYALVHALPMRRQHAVIGVVTVYAESSAGLTELDADMGQALVDVATVGLLQERSLREARMLSDQLQGALNSRIVIEQAKGMLSERRQIPVDDAFDLLRRHARNTNKKLSLVAEGLLAGTVAPDELTPAG